MIFEINKKSMVELQKKITKDVGENIKDEIKAQLVHINSDYEWVADSWELSDITNGIRILGSEEWAAAALNHGVEFNWTKMPPIEKLEDWVREHKDGGKYKSAPKKIIHNIAAAIAVKLVEEGWDKNHPALWYTDSAVLFSGGPVTLE